MLEINEHVALPVRITLTRLIAQNSGSEVSLRLTLENGEHREQKSLLITMEQYCELQPQKGEVSEEMYDRLESAAEFCRALRTGEHLLSYGANSVQRLAQKLMQRGFSREIAGKAAQKLCEMGLIDERSDVCREVERCLGKLWGSKRIKTHLWSRGFAAESLSELSELLAEVDFVGNCARLIQKHYGEVPTDRDEVRRMFASLSRYGYSINEIKEAIKTL